LGSQPYTASAVWLEPTTLTKKSLLQPMSMFVVQAAGIFGPYLVTVWGVLLVSARRAKKKWRCCLTQSISSSRYPPLLSLIPYRSSPCRIYYPKSSCMQVQVPGLPFCDCLRVLRSGLMISRQDLGLWIPSRTMETSSDCGITTNSMNNVTTIPVRYCLSTVNEHISELKGTQP